MGTLWGRTVRLFHFSSPAQPQKCLVSVCMNRGGWFRERLCFVFGGWGKRSGKDWSLQILKILGDFRLQETFFTDTSYVLFLICNVLAIVGLIMGIKTRCNQTQHRGCVLTLKTIWKEKEKRQPHCCSGFVPGCTHYWPFQWDWLGLDTFPTHLVPSKSKLEGFLVLFLRVWHVCGWTKR